MGKSKKVSGGKIKLECSKCGKFIAKEDAVDEHGKLTHKGCGGWLRALKSGK